MTKMVTISPETVTKKVISSKREAHHRANNRATYPNSYLDAGNTPIATSSQ